jgi:flagellar basal body-associated protein FliL
LKSVECCIGIVVLVILTFGVIFALSWAMSAKARSERIAWAKTLNDLSLPELETISSELEAEKKDLQKQRLLANAFKRNRIDMNLAECGERIKILKVLIENR